MITYREAKKDELPEISALMAQAFDGYIYYTMQIDDGEKCRKFLAALQLVGVRAYFKRQLVLVGLQDGKITAAASMRSPDRPKISLFDYILAGGHKVLFAAGPGKAQDFLKMADEASAACYALPGRVWYLESLAVSPACQGQGLGGRMLQDCLIPYIVAHGGGTLALITNSRGNYAFYEKNGFSEFACTVIERKGKEMENRSFKLDIPAV